MISEVWLPIPSYERYYMASNLGRVKSLDRYVKRSRGGVQLARSTILRQSMSGEYRAVGLSKNGKRTTHRVHRLVAMAWLGGIPKGMVINHFDCNKLNNNTSNLELTTQTKNIAHAVQNGHTKGYKKRIKNNG